MVATLVALHKNGLPRCSTKSFVRLDLSGEIDMLDFVKVVSDHLGRAVGLNDDALYGVSVAVGESVVNAIVHGNRNDRDKRVFVEFAWMDGDPQGIAIRVRDQGSGFDPATLADPLSRENLMKPSGRGIFLIRTFMDELTLKRAAEGGMEIMMVKHFQPQTPNGPTPDAEIASDR
jgi:serine/threonine-protein kinase RsbW